jgi:polyhydroxybutyrate depolymerase
MVGDVKYAYHLHIPPGLDGLQPVPVVFAFHGYTGGALEVLGFSEVADQQGFLVVYPSGYGVSWNAGGCCGPAAKDNADDVAFVRQMLTDLGILVNIDPKRIYSTGWSNGAMFSYRLACEMSDTFAAIAPVSGPLVTTPCQPQQPVSVMQEHGLVDTEVPFAGGQGTSVVADVFFPPVEDGITFWAQVDGCTGTPQVEKQGTLIHTVYPGCKAGSAVELYTIEGGRHGWPSRFVFPALSPQAMWDFFKAHPKP